MTDEDLPVTAFSVRYLPKFDYFVLELGGVTQLCVACNKPLQYREPHGPNYHQCDAKHMAARQAAMTRSEEPQTRTPPFTERLADGLIMLDEDQNGNIHRDY